MVSFVETLLGLTAVIFVIALAVFLRGNRPRARQLALWVGILGALAIAGEIYIRR